MAGELTTAEELKLADIAKLDTNKDGKVSRKEFDDGLKSFFVVGESGCITQEIDAADIKDDSNTHLIDSFDYGETTKPSNAMEFTEKGIRPYPILVDDSGKMASLRDVDPVDMEEFSRIVRKVPMDYSNKPTIYQDNPELPVTKGTADITCQHQRTNIPLVFKYMRGLVELAGVTVYVNFNEYKGENSIKREIFKIICNDPQCMYFWIPIVDYTAPTMKQLTFWIELCKTCRDSNLNMVYHCGSGDGRTGYMTLCNLLYMEDQGNPGRAATLLSEVKGTVPPEIGTWSTIPSLPGNVLELKLNEKPDSEITVGPSAPSWVSDKFFLHGGKYGLLWTFYLTQTGLYKILTPIMSEPGIKELFNLQIIGASSKAKLLIERINLAEELLQRVAIPSTGGGTHRPRRKTRKSKRKTRRKKTRKRKTRKRKTRKRKTRKVH